MTKKELKRERDAKRYWRKRAKEAEKELQQRPNVTVINPRPRPEIVLPTSGPGWPKIGDVTCSLGNF